jgi:protein phosphatase
MEIRPGVELANLTDAGCERENNEDYFAYCEPETDEEFVRKGRLAIIADGMGGEEGGEIASRIAIDTVRHEYLNSAESNPLNSLVQSFQAAHANILDFARQRPDVHSMGTTCTAVAINDGFAYFAHVGDSRLYLIRNSLILQLTHDHTAINRMLEDGVITPEEAENHPQRHVLTAALGAKHEIKADIAQAPIPLEIGDVLLLCTDGLWGLVSDSDILSVVRTHAPRDACKQLVQMAKERGGPDNITIQILRIGDALEDTRRNGNGR